MSFAAMMEQLKQEYIESLPEKIQTIEGHIKTQCTDSLKEDFHKLKGTGKTYGLPEISTLAASIESICIHSPEKSVEAAVQALPILQDIHQSRVADQSHDIGSDERFIQIRRAAA